ncbi:MAG TPA: SRPBCC family protein [Burkholderiales bacterium]|nr:SRPBCC family protein [Burkholderiales bacterium]
MIGSKTRPGFTVRMTIERPWVDVYRFVANPQNLAAWASGLSKTAKVRFAEANRYGVLDHYVSLDGGPEVYVPMRVFPNGEGAEVLLTIFRHPGTSEEKFSEDARWVLRDLEALKALLEK